MQNSKTRYLRNLAEDCASRAQPARVPNPAFHTELQCAAEHRYAAQRSQANFEKRAYRLSYKRITQILQSFCVAGAEHLGHHCS
eukprot:6213962-Pleurochrysis_carterae.AAC.1